MLNGDVGYKYLRRKTKEERAMRDRAKKTEITFLPEDPRKAIVILECVQDQYPVTHSQHGKIQEQINKLRAKVKE